MEEINKADIEQLKRDLYTYGYYTKKIEELQSKLYELGLQLKDRERAQGINYDEKVGCSDPYHPSTASLIYEEESVQIELESIRNKRSKLRLNEMEDTLTTEEYVVLSAHFFDDLSYSYIQVNLCYKNEEKVKRISNRGLKKILKRIIFCKENK